VQRFPVAGRLALTTDISVVVKQATLCVDDKPFVLLALRIPVHLEVAREQANLLAVEAVRRLRSGVRQNQLRYLALH
jgi:hypothetical protein